MTEFLPITQAWKRHTDAWINNLHALSAYLETLLFVMQLRHEISECKKALEERKAI